MVEQNYRITVIITKWIESNRIGLDWIGWNSSISAHNTFLMKQSTQWTLKLLQKSIQNRIQKLYCGKFEQSAQEMHINNTLLIVFFLYAACSSCPSTHFGLFFLHIVCLEFYRHSQHIFHLAEVVRWLIDVGLL